MNVSALIFGLLIFASMLIAGVLFYSSMALNYGVETPASMGTIVQHVNESIIGKSTTMAQQAQNSSQMTQLTGIGAVDSAFNFFWSISNNLWSVALLMFNIPDMLSAVTNDIGIMFGIPKFFIDIIGVMVILTIVFALLKLIFKVDV